MTLRENERAFERVWLKPRVMVDVTSGGGPRLASAMLGHACAAPLYITATALGKLAHPDGELALARAAGNTGLVQMIPTLGSYGLEDVVAAAKPGQPQLFQLYVNEDRAMARDIVRRAQMLGVKAIVVTVDAPQVRK